LELERWMVPERALPQAERQGTSAPLAPPEERLACLQPGHRHFRRDGAGVRHSLGANLPIECASCAEHRGSSSPRPAWA